MTTSDDIRKTWNEEIANLESTRHDLRRSLSRVRTRIHRLKKSLDAINQISLPLESSIRKR